MKSSNFLVTMHPGKCSDHFCDLFAEWKYCRSDYIKIISLVIPYNTINSYWLDNQELPCKLTANLMWDSEPQTAGLLQGI